MIYTSKINTAKRELTTRYTYYCDISAEKKFGALFIDLSFSVSLFLIVAYAYLKE